ncbi:hypothetical protein [Trueperella abortisuis]|nr:hypothetical protein [Trueperella abortisuis]
MNVTIIDCAKCGNPIWVTTTTSLCRPDGEPYKVYHARCYREEMASDHDQ